MNKDYNINDDLSDGFPGKDDTCCAYVFGGPGLKVKSRQQHHRITDATGPRIHSNSGLPKDNFLLFINILNLKRNKTLLSYVPTSSSRP